MSASAVARTMLRTLALSASKNPIEVIVSCFIIVTLAYFQLLHAVTTSHFFEPLNREAAGLSSTSLFASPSPLLGSEDGAGAVVISHPDHSGRLPFRLEKTFVRPAGASSRWEQVAADFDAAQAGSQPWIVEPVIVADSERKGAGRRLPESALPVATRKLFAKLHLAHVSQPQPADAAAQRDISAWTFGRTHHDDSIEGRRAFLERASDEALLGTALNESSMRAPAASRLRFVPILSDYDLETAHPHGLAVATPEELRSVRWMAYAARALVLRFWALFKRADSADIFVMLSAYILMHGTFINLFLSMRKFGSRFWLGASVLISSIFAFMCALTAAYSLGVTVDPICLSEALPFLVIIVGFEKPYLLTRAVYTHPGATPLKAKAANGSKPAMSLGLSTMDSDAVQGSDGASDGISEDLGEIESIMAGAGELSREESFVRALTARLKSEPSLRLAGPTAQVPVHQVILAAVEGVGMQILRDYVVEITVMVVGASSGVSGLREFCQLAALILTFDCIALFSFYIAILTVMLEVHRIRVLRGAPRPRAATPPNVDSDEPVSGLATPTSSSVSARVTPRQVSPSRASSAGAAQPAWRRALEKIFGRGAFGTGAENMTARLKVMLIMSFLVLHSLNLVSTLTTQAALSRHHSTGAPTAYQAIAGSSAIFSDRPDSPSVAPLLNSLIKASPADADIFVRIMDPVVYLLVDEGDGAELSRFEMANAALNASGLQAKAAEAASLAAAAEADKTTSQRGSSSLAVLDSFITGWTVIVGDPVIGKWMSLALAISIFLNAYLLKGIASGDAAVADRNAAGAAALAVARMVGAHLDREGLASDAKLKEDLAAAKAQGAKAGMDAYHKQLAAKSASAAKGYLDRLPQDREASTGAGPTLHKPIAVPAKAVSPSAAASVHSASNSAAADVPVSADGDGAHLTPNARSEEWKSQRAGFIGQDGEVEVRGFEEMLELYAGGAGVFLLSDEEVILLAQKGKIAGYALEKILQDHERAVRVRRALISRSSSSQTLETSKLPFSNYDYSQVMGACCENVVGYMPLPVGIAGPLKIDGHLIPIPMATTEGTLVASTSRGCKALNAGGGVTTVLTQDAMTRGPALEFPSIVSAAKAKRWVDSAEGTAILKEAFDSTSRFARLSSLTTAMAGRTLYIRFATSTGDAMGMNMIGKGCNEALAVMGRYFPDMKLLALSGNYCIDKKASAINWILGRGKSVVAEAVVPAKTVETVLKTTVDDLVNLNLKKNLVGSAMAGSIGGMNAHAANIVAAFFLATGQDPAQVVESSMCMTLIEKTSEGDMLMTVSMPSLEVGTVGGGTFLHPQRAMLEMLGCAGAAPVAGAHAQKLARCIAAAVMAGELSLLSALAANHLIQAHMKHNRSAPPTPGTQTPMRSETPSFRKDFIGGSLTPLVAPSVGGSSTGPPSRGSPTETRERRSASSLN